MVELLLADWFPVVLELLVIFDAVVLVLFEDAGGVEFPDFATPPSVVLLPPVVLEVAVVWDPPSVEAPLVPSVVLADVFVVEVWLVGPEEELELSVEELLVEAVDPDCVELPVSVVVFVALVDACG